MAAVILSLNEGTEEEIDFMGLIQGVIQASGSTMLSPIPAMKPRIDAD
jgi:hypothetical protein